MGPSAERCGHDRAGLLLAFNLGLIGSAPHSTTHTQAGGTWLLSSHAPVDAPAIHAALAGCQALGQAGGSVTLKQEPLVLHVECRDLAAAEGLLRVGVGSGFRESGISLGKKRVLVAIRTGANSLEVRAWLRDLIQVCVYG